MVSLKNLVYCVIVIWLSLTELKVLTVFLEVVFRFIRSVMIFLSFFLLIFLMLNLFFSHSG